MGIEPRDDSEPYQSIFQRLLCYFLSSLHFSQFSHFSHGETVFRGFEQAGKFIVPLFMSFYALLPKNLFFYAQLCLCHSIHGSIWLIHLAQPPFRHRHAALCKFQPNKQRCSNMSQKLPFSEKTSKNSVLPANSNKRRLNVLKMKEFMCSEIVHQSELELEATAQGGMHIF